MHRALQITELLSLVCRYLQVTKGPYRGRRKQLLSFALACKPFADVALDLIWRDIRSVRELLNVLSIDLVWDPGPLLRLRSEVDSVGWERLKFYANRVHKLNVEVQLHPDLLLEVDRRQRNEASSIFPRLKTLSVSVCNSRDVAVDHLRAFLRPSVTSLSLRFSKASYPNIGHALECVTTPSLLSLTTLELHVDFYPMEPLDATIFESQLCNHVSLLSSLKCIRLPLCLFTSKTLSSIASLPRLEGLFVDPPLIFGTSYPRLPVHPGDFSCLQTLSIDAISDTASQIFQVHPAFFRVPQVSLATHLGSQMQQEQFDLFVFPFLRSLTHLDLDLHNEGELNKDDPPLRIDFFSPLFSACRSLVILKVNHARPLDFDDEDIETLVRHAPSLEVADLASTPYEPLTGFESLFEVRTTLACLQSFARHCPNIREIALPMNVWTKGPPAVTDVTFREPVILDMSVSPVTRKISAVASFIAKLCPHKCSQVTSRYAGWEKGYENDVDSDDDSDGSDSDATPDSFDKRGGFKYSRILAGRWREVDRLARKERQRVDDKSQT